MVSALVPPTISIVMPLYNKAATVSSSISSVLRQSVTDWELIVVDDGSSDHGAEIASSFGDFRIRIHMQENRGVSAARNLGIELARADLIAFLDADDSWADDFLERILSLRNDFPHGIWFGTRYELRSPSGARIPARIRKIRSDFRRGILTNYFEVAAASDPPVFTSAVAVRKSALVDVGGFPPGVTSGEDLLTWAKIALDGPLAYDMGIYAVFNVSGIERPLDCSNMVGYTLEAIFENRSEVIGLRCYLGLWYRMQSVMALRHRQRMLACRLATRAVYWCPVAIRNWYQLFQAVLPFGFGSRLDMMLRRLKKSCDGYC